MPLNAALDSLMAKIIGPDSEKVKDIYYGIWAVNDCELVKKVVLGILGFASEDYEFDISFNIPKEKINDLDYIEVMYDDSEFDAENLIRVMY